MSDNFLDADVIVVGLGAWGSQALWRLAERGVRVIGVERYGIGHHLGSTHGTTRVFRVACHEHPGLAPIATRARDLWYDLGERTGQTLLRQTGGLMVGPPDGHVVEGTLRAATDAGLKVEVIEHDELGERFPQYRGFGPDDIGVWDPAAGVCYPELGVRAAVEVAVSLGATVLTDTRVTDVRLIDDGVEVEAGGRTLRARRAVMTAGAWTSKFLDLPLSPRRMPMFWFESSDPSDIEPDGQFDLSAFPVFIRQLPSGLALWGHGADATDGEGYAVKIGLQDIGGVFTDTDADTVDRYIRPASDYATLSKAVDGAFRDLEPTPAKAIPCMVTNTPDKQFLLGRVAGDPRLVLAGGDSGHGFKHAPAIGELLAELALDEEPFTDIQFMSPDREYDGTSWADDPHHPTKKAA
ncbi:MULTISPECIES: N-methyl-L-tryptophan oxidase [Microbacterium]|jgi:sarcosine oxidase|uniref:N-methyl-L-tryptophan oxidase n=1 Tax=Microbacterium TaxID=33882 RepID=UPI0023DAB2EB|nr:MULTISPECIES: N-methyl-L-tryptophan oxidase [Microbacterium]MDF2045019.1 N-methyl-L-tryptophan oxidase [Microbacterium sp. Kw_RZR3]MDF2917109.1 dependent oxidoreductase [Microbacterium sp.]MDQ1075558.1 sarcosine oxidase [Microbacterium sp. SORGH_AS_0969]MDQ1115797.1 sarcosine oxidase [Microbacterium testaceum]